MLKKYKIVGGKPLTGTVCIAGSKNAALPIFAATLLTEEKVILHNVPVLRDTYTMIRLLERLGKCIVRDGTTVTITSSETLVQQPVRAVYEIVKQMRASICVLGPLLTRYGRVEVALPGGCVFGPRPVDLHLKGLALLGADIAIKHGDIIAAAQGETLRGGRVNLLGKFGTSVLATDNVLSAAVLAKGRTIIEHAAQEPETEDLIHFLQALGAQITYRTHKGYATIEIEGVNCLHGAEYTIIPDRIEAGTYMIFSALTGGSLTLTHVREEHLEVPIAILRDIGFDITSTPITPSTPSTPHPLHYSKQNIPENASKNALSKPGHARSDSTGGSKRSQNTPDSNGSNVFSNPMPAGTTMSKIEHSVPYLEQTMTLHSYPLAKCNPFTLTTGAYPNFPTDLQPLFMALGTMLPGSSMIYESIYPNRFNHAPELARMGADITIEGNSARINGVNALQGARVQASDLRAGAALVGAALSAEGESEIKRIYHIERGYENMVAKLIALGATIELDQDPIV